MLQKTHTGCTERNQAGGATVRPTDFGLPRFVLYDSYARADLAGGRELVARPAFGGGAAVWEGEACAERHDSVQFFDTWGAALDYVWGRAGAGSGVGLEKGP